MANQVGEINVKIGADTSSLEKGVETAKKDLGSLDKSAKGAKSSLGGLSLYAKAGALALGAMAVKGALVADNFGRLETRIRTATSSTAEFNTAMDGLYKSAQNSGVALEGTVAAFQNIYASAQEIGKTTEDTIKFVDTFQKLGVIGGASTTEINNSLRQTSQAIAGGVLRAEEFNSIVENTPAVARAIAEGMSLTVGQLRNAVLEGRVLSEDVFNALNSQSEQVNKKFEQMPLTLEQAGTSLINSIGTALSDINQFDQKIRGVGSATEAVAVAMKGISVYIDDGVDGLIAYRDKLAEIENINKRITLSRGNVGLNLAAEYEAQVNEQLEIQLQKAEQMQSWMEMRSDASRGFRENQQAITEAMERQAQIEAEQAARKAEKTEQENEQYAWLNIDDIFEQLETEYATREAHEIAITEMERAHKQFRIDMAQEEEERRIASAERVAKAEMSINNTLLSNATGFFNQLAGKSKAAAIAALALTKAKAINDVFIQTQVASMRALAELGPIAGPPAAAAIQTKGNISAGLIAATGLMQAASIGTGGSSAINTTSSASSVASGASPAAPVGGTLTVQGLSSSSLFTGDVVSQLAEELLSFQRAGGNIVLQG
jgi:tape measure domain-containing protein